MQFKRVMLPGTEYYIDCEMSTNKARPYLPESFRRVAFNSIHNLSHPGIRATNKMVGDRYFWVGMNKDIRNWAKTCIACQRAKVQRHTVSGLGTFESAGRFDHLHIDCIGPIRTSPDGFRYCVTMIDRFTRWPGVVPIKEMTAETVAKALYEHWIVRFGCPKRLTSDLAKNFQSKLFTHLMLLLGVKQFRTTAYHPQSNGAVERYHKSLKNALTARLISSDSWVQELPTALLGLRAAVRVDTNVSSAELVYGTSIRLPGDFYDNSV